MKVRILFVVIVFLVFSSLFTFSLCKHDDDNYSGIDDDHHIKVNTKVKDHNGGDETIVVNVVINNNHHHHNHEHKELDDIQDDKANRCKGFNNGGDSSDNSDNDGVSNTNSNTDDSEDNGDENAKNHQHQHQHHHHHSDGGRDICGCKFGRYGKDCRKRELEYQNSFILWSNEFNRTYTANQFLAKYEAFKDSSRFIEQYQRENQNSTMTLGLTQFSDMTHDEFLHTYTSKLYEFNSNETSPSVGSCLVNITQTIVNSWIDGNNQHFIQVETIITNLGPTTIRSYSFKLDNVVSIWNVDTLSSNTNGSSSSNNYKLPNWISSIESGSSHTFGYIQTSNQTTPLYDETSTCDELPTSTPTTPTTPCNANITQIITNSWRENNIDFIQVETTITNIGETTILSYSFQLNDIQSIWNVDTLSNNTFSLPNWKNNIEVGSSHTFGYIQRSYSINPLLSINKLCKESSFSSKSISSSTTNDKLSNVGLLSRPVSFDWRTYGMVNYVKNQGSCGSCYTFSAVGALESHVKIKHNRLPDLSEQQLVDCTGNYGNGGCSGGWMHNCYKYIKENGGISSQSNYPYEGRVGACRFRSAQEKLTSYVMIPQHDEEALTNAVASVGPVAIAYDASTREFMYYRSGIYHSENCNKMRTTHAVVVVGYGVENGVDYYSIKNSWGSQWGEQGYFRMRRNTGNKCGVATLSSYPIVS